jgi:hypothetical protein
VTSKRVVKKKSASHKPQQSVSAKSVVRDALHNPEASLAAMVKEANKNRTKAKRVAKVVHLTVSVGDDDRGRTYEKFVDFIQKTLGVVEYGKPGVHASVTGGHYVLDGAVCRPEDYDPKKQTFNLGATPPPWAGGTKPSALGQQEQMQYDAVHLSDDEYDQKYQLGKYAPPPPPPSAFSRQSGETSAEHEARMRRERAARKAQEDEDLEEFDWDEDDVLDDDKMSAVADESVKRAIRKIKKTPKKRVVKKTAAPKKVVRRVKK